MTSVKPLKVAASLFLWFALMMSLATFYWWQWLHADHKIPKMNSFFVVQNGESLSSVATRLHNIDLIRWPKVWILYARFHDSAPIRRGEYQFRKTESPISILDKLQSDDVVKYSVTLIEGKRFSDYVALLARQKNIDAELSGMSDDERSQDIGIDVEHFEGWFFPDTYQYIAGDTDVAILRRAHRKMKEVLTSEWAVRVEGLPYSTPYEALIMASIIEKETALATERTAIAGVFVRRLQSGMRLQTDPTVIYGLGESFDGNLTRKHLKTPTPYNTYTNFGLPPTPIAMPSGEAIHAALNPMLGDSLYFVAKGDGSHFFSASLEEHNKAVSEFQKLRRIKIYRSTPESIPTSESKSVESKSVESDEE